MRTWRRVIDMEHCGGCGQTLKPGQPMQVVESDPSRNLKRKRPFVRCVFCADGTPPDDIPPMVLRSRVIKPSVLIPTGPGTLPLDFKRPTARVLQALLPSREPGEDG
jgi:hypothetical protein